MTEETAHPRDLNALIRACPLGWVELQVEHHPGDSGPGGSTPQEPDTSIHLARVWGMTPDDLDGVNAALDELYRDAEGFHEMARKVPNHGTLLRRITQRPVNCPSCQQVMAETTRLALCSACGITFVAPVGLEELEGA